MRELIDKFMNKPVEDVGDSEASVESTIRDDPEEEFALREVEKTALRGPELDRLAALFPPPQFWFDEPE